MGNLATPQNTDKMDSQTLFNVQDKVVLVTGGPKGIGRMIATAFVTNGAKVYLTGRSSKDLDAAARDLASAGKHAPTPIPANLQNLDECKYLVAKITEAEPGGIHVLVNNAGATWGADIDSYPDEAWNKVLTLNLTRAFTLTQLCLPLLEKGATKADPSRVIHIG